MGDMTVTVTGLDQFAAAVRRIGQQLPGAVGDQLKTELRGVLAASQQLVPVDTGALKESGFVDDPAVSGGHVVDRIGYDTPYALQQHELNYRHPHGGQRKYLGEPLEAWLGDGPGRVVRRAVEGLGR
jgi:hypothetical protein